MLRPFLISAGLGVVSALFFLSVVTGSIGAVIFMLMASMPLFGAALGLALPGVAVAGAAGALVVGVVGGIETAVTYLVMVAGPPGLVAWQGLRSRPDGKGGVAWYPPGLLLVWLVGHAAAAFGLIWLMTLGIQGGLMALLRDQVGLLVSDMTAGAGVPIALSDLSRLIDVFVMTLPGTALATWIMLLIGNAALAQGALTRFGWALRPGMRLQEIELPITVHAVFVGLIALSAVLGGQAQFAAINLAIILSVPFFLLGLSIVHAIADRLSSGWLFLTLFYVLLLITNAWVLALMVGLGFIEHWFGARHRLSRP